jgi:tRNA dimethylallyltransferase
MASEKTLLVIAGPTASGKTALSIALAQHFRAPILSFDSRQCYRELNIGVAKPSPAELQAVPHYFIGTHSIHEPVDAAGFEKYALQTLEQLFQHHDTVVAVGGTGLYMKVLCEGIDEMPEVPESIRQSIRQQYEQEGLPWLQQAIRDEDTVYATDGEMQNPHRLMRALEIKRASGQSIRHFQQFGKTTRPFRIIKMGIDLPKPLLHERINTRVDAMMEAGQLEEARQLLPFRHLQALQTVGYKELFDYFDGNCTLAEAVESIKSNTRQYAKRQLTWFRKDKEITWLPDTQPAHYIACFNEQTGKIK